MITAASGWIAQDGTPDAAMFYRNRRDKDGVSLATSIPAGISRMKRVGRTVQGIRSLHVGWVKDVKPPAGKLDVRSKSVDDTHAAITGLPFEDEDLREVERLVDKLLAVSRFEVLPR